MNRKPVMMMVCAAIGFQLAGCSKDADGVESGAATAPNTNTNSDETTGDGDGDPGDGDGDGEAETGDTTGNTTMGTTAGFVPPVGGDAMGISDCDPWLQDCKDGEKCVPYSSTGAGVWDANKCVPVMGEGEPGDNCIYSNISEATDDCGEDSHCWDVMDVDGVNQGVCTPFCTGSPDDPICDLGTSCLVANEGSINLCIATCDPLTQDCGPGLACFWANNNFNCIFTTSDIPSGEPCAYINDCAMGLICLTAETLPSCDGSACCGSYCSLSDDPVAACVAVPGTECVSFFDEGMAPPEYVDVGVCIIPGA